MGANYPNTESIVALLRTLAKNKSVRAKKVFFIIAVTARATGPSILYAF